MAKKYAINPDFKKLGYLHMPKYRWFLFVANSFMKLLYYLKKPPAGVSMRRLSIPMRDGYRLKADLFTTAGSEGKKPCLVYFPGGGFIMRATHIHKHNLIEMVRSLSISGVMVHYRLAPKYKYPTAFFDCIDSFTYLVDNADEFGLSLDHIGIGGDSAGGNLAGGLALFNKDKLHKKLKLVFMVYPALDSGLESESREHYFDTPMLNSHIFTTVKKLFYTNGVFNLDKYAFPLLHPDLTGFGPAYIETAEFDPLHDDGVLFHRRLVASGEVSELNETKGTVHGYDIVLKSPIVQESMKKRIDFISRHI